MVRFTRDAEGEEVREPLLRPLFNDMVACEELLERATQAERLFARRTYVRSSFAYFEGHLYWLKSAVEKWVLVQGWQAQNIEVTKIILLGDQTYKPDKTGRLVAEPQRLPFLNWCAFILRTASECCGIDPNRFFGDNGWNSLQSAVRVRHRLTHPKRPEDMEISDAEIDILREAHAWFVNCIFALVNKIKIQTRSP